MISIYKYILAHVTSHIGKKRFSNPTLLFSEFGILFSVWLHQTRIGLSLYDVAGQGYLKESVSLQ